GPVPAAESMADDRNYRGSFSDGRPVAPDQWPMARALRGEAVAPVELRLHRSDGQTFIAEAAAAPIRDEQGGVVAAVKTLIDITERKQHEEELRRALRFRDEIMAVLSHDLRTPLMVVMTGAELLLRGDGLND